MTNQRYFGCWHGDSGNTIVPYGKYPLMKRGGGADNGFSIFATGSGAEGGKSEYSFRPTIAVY